MSSQELLSTSGEALSEVARLLSTIDAETAADARARSARVEARRQGPLVLAIAGEDEKARAAFLNRLLGEALVPEDRTTPPGASVRFRRGLRLEYRVTLKNGNEVTFSGRHPDKREALVAAASAAAREAEQAALELAAVEKEPQLGEAAAADERRARAEAALAEARELRDMIRASREKTSTALVAARRGWRGVKTFLAWLVGLVAGWFRWGRARPQALSEGPTLASLDEQLARAEARVDASREELAAAEDSVSRVISRREKLGAARMATGAAKAKKERADAEVQAHAASRREAFRTEVRALTDARGRGPEVVSVEVTAPACPEGLILVDLAVKGSTNELVQGWEVCRREVDGCLWVGRGEPPEQLKRLFLHIGRVPKAEALIASLPDLSARQRALAAGRTALEAVRTAESSLDQLELRAGAAGKARLEKLRAQRIGDPRPLMEAALKRVTPWVVERSQLAIRRASDQTGWEVDRLLAQWSERFEACSDADALRRVAGDLADRGPGALEALEEDLQRSLVSSLNGGVRDLEAPFISEVIARFNNVEELLEEPPTPGGSPDFRRRKLVAADVIEPSRRLLEPGGTTLQIGIQPLASSLLGKHATKIGEGLSGGFAGRFRAFDKLREEAITKLKDRLFSLRQEAQADLLEAEPELARVLREALEGLGARAAAALDGTVDTLAAAEDAGLEHDLAHLRATLATVRVELACRQAPLQASIETLGREIDRILGA